MFDTKEKEKPFEILCEYYNKIKAHKQIKNIIDTSINRKIPYKVAIGIYIMETFYRPIYIRIVEYLLLVIGIFLNVIFKIPLRNITIGKLQIGLGTILSYYGNVKIGMHDRYIYSLSINQIMFIFKAISWKYQLEILYWWYKIHGLNETPGKIGYLYNGEIIYGIMLQRLVNIIDYNNCESKVSLSNGNYRLGM
ncbi:MAG: hypothetical protein H7Y41_00790 [Hyphomonadaceae bacterium]|nr:hypothetical protein [Clostridia bacterium]